MLWASADMVR